MAGTRRYSSELRSEQTALARRLILDTAHRLFVERGYLGTTLAAVAATAGVSVQTVYNVVGGKSVLLKTVYDVAMAGDDQPVPVAERPAVRAMMAAPDGRTCLTLYAETGRVLGQRVLPLLIPLYAQAAAGDADLTNFVDTIERERAVGTGRVAGFVADRFGLREGLTTQDAADILWVLNGPDLADRLVNQRGWGWDKTQQWIGTAMADALLGPEA